MMRNRKLKWTFELCKIEALKYNSRAEFKRNSQSAYSRALKSKWLDDICLHMISTKKCKNYWDFEKCREESLKYKDKKEFRKNSYSAYQRCCKEGWIDDFCKNMTQRIRKRNGYWTKDRCIEEALKYDNYSDFIKNGKGAIQASRRNGWYNEITSHFIIKGNRYKRFIYAYEFPDNHVYVGLTHNIKERCNMHNIQGSVFQYKELTNLEPEFKQLTFTPVDVKEARILEKYYLNEYISKGWIKLNKRDTGAVGSLYNKWSYDNCKKEALQYNKVSDFMKNNKSAYNSACRNGWLDEICSHMIKTRKPKGYYTLEKCIELAKDCYSITDMKEKYGTATRLVYQNGWKTKVEKFFKAYNYCGHFLNQDEEV